MTTCDDMIDKQIETAIDDRNTKHDRAIKVLRRHTTTKHRLVTLKDRYDALYDLTWCFWFDWLLTCLLLTDDAYESIRLDAAIVRNLARFVHRLVRSYATAHDSTYVPIESPIDLPAEVQTGRLCNDCISSILYCSYQTTKDALLFINGMPASTSVLSPSLARIHELILDATHKISVRCVTFSKQLATMSFTKRPKMKPKTKAKSKPQPQWTDVFNHQD